MCTERCHVIRTKRLAACHRALANSLDRLRAVGGGSLHRLNAYIVRRSDTRDVALCA